LRAGADNGKDARHRRDGEQGQEARAVGQSLKSS
jgi:hypothetical protein